MMKSIGYIKLGLSAIALCLLTLQSCEKDKIIKKETCSDEAGNVSTTGNSGAKSLDGENMIEPDIHLHLSGDLSREEATAIWEEYAQKATDSIEKFDSSFRKMTGNKFWYQIETKTSTNNNAGTDGAVSARIDYITDRTLSNGSHPVARVGWVSLNNPGDDREEGHWDFYRIYAGIDNLGFQPSWIQITRSEIALKGTDGWHLQYFDTFILSSYQSEASSGSSFIIHDAWKWLDNSSSTAWDFYSVNKSNAGKIYFPN